MFRKLTVKEVTFKLKAILYENKIYFKTIKVSGFGSRYLSIVYDDYRETIRIADHHENNRRLPRYNVLVGYDIDPETLSRTGKRYYNESQLLDIVKHIKRDAGKKDEIIERMAKPRDRVAQIERYCESKYSKPKRKSTGRKRKTTRRAGVW